ncbi:MAG TPA: hypothetical protein VHW01_17940 [Polyangiaceae bacterium]|jgi:hypothetical protein|nr:hypothetical protein [Polyangiaceae bacterium]
MDRDVLASRIAHVRFDREVLDDVQPGLTMPADAGLLAEITQYQEQVGMVMPAPEQELAHGYAIGI